MSGKKDNKTAGPSKPVERKFNHARDISVALQDQNEANMTKSLTALRNQLTVKYEERVSVTDERILLLQGWLASSPGARDVFGVWEQCSTRQQTLQAAIVSLLSAIVTLLSSHYSLQPLAAPIVNALLSSQWLPKLNGYLSSTHRDLILFVLKLFNSLSLYAGGQERKLLLEAFAWESKSLTKLLNMRRRGGDARSNLAVPDIRSLFILFILSLVDPSTSSSVKAAFLEQRREIFTSTFKGLPEDSYPLARKILEVCWSGIWLDQKIKRSCKVAVFQESTITQITKLYERKASEGPDPDDIPADLAHHFLLAVCTSPGVGVCFRDRGWYPRETSDTGAEVSTKKASGLVYNRILGNVLNGLKINEDSRQQELALRILKACPELVAGYWAGSSLTLEPRLSSKWIANIAFLGSVISQPVPIATFKLPTAQDLYNPSAPTVTAIVENILPSANIKVHLSRGLQSTSALVQHCTALALAKCLTKYHSVMQAFQTIENALNEGSDGRWSARRTELEREVRRRVPELQVVLAFAQQKGQDILQEPDAATTSAKAPIANASKNALLLECAQRLLWLYHQLLPNLVSEARFDVGKLLQTTYAAESGRSSEVTAGIDTLRHLHVLRLLGSSDQFSWSAKTGPHSNFGTLLKFYISTRSSAIRSAIQSLLERSLSGNLMFQHDADEVSLWLESLTRTRIDSTNGQALKDEDARAIISFWDDCAQRYMKTPYRYIEEQRSLLSSTDIVMGDKSPSTVTDHPETCPSPLLMVFVDQVCAKMNPQKTIDSDIYPIFRFLHRLFIRLASKAPSLSLLRPIVDYFKSGLQLEERLLSEAAPAFTIVQEVQALTVDLARVEEGPVAQKPAAEFLELTSEGEVHGSDFLTLFLQVKDAVTDKACRDILVEAVLREPVRVLALKRSLALLNHRLVACSDHNEIWGGLLLLVSAIAQEVKRLPAEHVLSVKLLVLQMSSFKGCSSSVLNEGRRHDLVTLLHQLLDEHDETDRNLIVEHVSYWFQLVANNGITGDEGETALLWMRYMSTSQIWTFIDLASSGELLSNESPLEAVVDLLLSRLPEALRQSDAMQHPQRLEQLVRLQSILPNSNALEPILALAINAQIPPIYPTGLEHSSTETSITVALALSRQQNRRRAKQSRNDLNISQFLSAASWTSHTRQIVVDLLYVQPTTRPQVLLWVRENVGTCSVDNLAAIVLALVDSASAPEDLVLRNISSLRQGILDVVSAECRSLKSSAITLELLDITSTLHSACGEDANKLVQGILDHAWTWAVDTLSSQNTISIDEYEYKTLELLTTLFHKSANLKSHLVEPVIAVAVQNHLTDAKVLDFVREIVKTAALKPATINKQLQTVVQHERLYELCGSTVVQHERLYELCGSNSRPELRLSIINLLHVLFHLHPTNTCQPSHIGPLVSLYGGTLSAFDVRLLSILQLYETTRKTSSASWLKSRGGSFETAQALTAIQVLDPNIVFRTCANYPQWRRLSLENEGAVADDTLYDPVYVILLVAQLLAEQGTYPALVWVQVFRTNVVSLLIRALSSTDGAIREVALVQITGIYWCIQETDMVENPHVLHILNLLKDLYPPSPPLSSTPPIRLPAYTTLHLSHSLRALFYPSQFTYPLTARHLLQRPALDVTDVPMLYATLYSAEEGWKRERAWMVRFLGDGMVGRREWGVLRRRHTWDLVASGFQGTGDRAFRQGALKLLANITSKPFTITQLVLKSSLLAWLEVQLEDLKLGEELAWLKVIENLIVLSDTGKLDAATNGEWKMTLGRCVLAILKQAATTIDILYRALQVLLRLTLLHPTNPQLPTLISTSFTHLESLETALPSTILKPATPPSVPPHLGQNLFRPSNPNDDTTHATWWYGQCVETLWRVAVALPEPVERWDDLTTKLLILRAYAGPGPEGSVIGEWARREVVFVFVS
ncbi:hypothetical protein EUX98_g5899 [Antrodiella citrinella]|uniref:Nucleolar pre-ribosomal-associated protein 1 N-terminal domain-containing protein n=1 Tax=Antrodiella citrinella TaxID=2447956 RepID=A0A4S4MSH4_9APHY|nr:hypothetical protein EUX98_g5899 [Antrodiella citrinella]